VRYVVDGNLSGEITAFTPHYIENLPAGDHQLQLTLQDQNGNPIAGPFNDTTRTIKVAPDCKAHATATASPPAAASGKTAVNPPANAPLVTTPTPHGPATPPTAAPSERPLPSTAK
jgi:hypothetical protein